MKSTTLMLLGAIITLFALILAEQTIGAFFFRNLTFIPASFFADVLPPVALIIALIGVVIGLVGFFQKNS